MTPSRNTTPSPLLEFRNVTVIKGKKKVLDGISITICEGEQIAILGPNGAGKSSFIKAISREYYPVLQDDDVVFRIWGQDVWHVTDLRSLLGIVSNDLQYTFYPGDIRSRRDPVRFLLKRRALFP